MIIRIRNLVVTSLLSLAAGFSPVSHGQQMGAGGQPGPGGPPTGNDGFRGPGTSGRESGPPSDFTRPSGDDWSLPGGRSSLPGSPPSRSREPSGDMDSSLPLNDVVSMVQQRFKATAVKTDTVVESGQLVYRIRLLSADKSKVWTVSVDARTGRIN